MKKEFILVISLVAIIALSGCTRSVCGNGTCERDETTANCAVDCGPIISSLGSLEVTVVSGFIGGTHLSGAQVVVTGYDTNVVTNKNGIALFEGLLPGTYHITASKEGYLSADVNATVMEGQVTNVRIKLPLHIEIPRTGIWTPIRDIGTRINSLGVYDGNLFTADDTGVLGTYNSDSNVWSVVKKFTFDIYSLAVYDGNLYTGQSDGTLGTYGKTGGTNIWSSLGDKGYGIYALAVYDGNLFTGQVGGTLGTYNSTSKIWTNLGVVDDSLYSLAVYDGNLYTGGASGVLGTYNSVSNVWFCYKYDDIWCDGDIGFVITSLAVYDGNLFTGQVIEDLGTYNSTSNKWSYLGRLRSLSPALVLAVYDGNLFTGDNDKPTQNLGGVLGTYKSGVWSSLGDKGADIISLAVYGGKLFTGQQDGTLGVYYKR